MKTVILWEHKVGQLCMYVKKSIRFEDDKNRK